MIQQLRLRFYLEILIYTFYKEYLKKLMIAISTDLALTMTRATIRIFFANHIGLLTGAYYYSTSSLAIENRRTLIASSM